MKFLVVERGYEYNDETYDMHDGYEIKSKLFKTEKEAERGMKEIILKQFKDWKGNFNSKNFNFNMFSYEPSYSMQDYFKKKGYEFEEDGYELSLPSGLSEEEVLEAWQNFDTELIYIIKVEE